MTYRALYRVWRPQRFADIVGQDHITRTLQNALKQQRLSHAYLFSGPRGTGKTSAAKIMAKAVNCERRGSSAAEPCNACAACEGVMAGSLLDVVEIDAASNRGIEEIRDLRDKVKYAPSEVRTKVYIIDEVHMLTPEAFNALLKTLEEPPQHVLFILATTEPHKLPLTIISRCQRFDFHRVSVETIVKRLAYICEQEKVEAEEAALILIAQVAAGGLRDALSLLDQALAFTEGRVTEADIRAIVGTAADAFFYKVAGLLEKREAAGLLDAASELMREGHDPERIAEDLLHYFRDMLLVKTAPHLAEAEHRLKTYKSLAKTANLFTEGEIFSIIEEIQQALNQMKQADQSHIVLELLLVKLTHVQKQPSDAGENELAALASRLDRLEKELKQLSEAPHRETPPESGGNAAPVRAAGKTERTRRRAANPPLSSVQAVRDAADAEALDDIKQKWTDILSQVKDKKITVHAWLINGEPVACSDSQLVIAFKNRIHRETTERPDHRQLIEAVIEQVIGRKYALVTCMQDEWAQLEAAGAEREQAAAEEKGSGDDHVRQALDLFGHDLVEIKDE